MRQAMSAGEFADLVGLSRDEVETYRSLGLLDPENDGLLDDVDLVRLDFVRHRLAQGYDAESLAAAIRDGRVESMYGRRLFEGEASLGLDEAAARAGLEPERLREVSSALGFSWSGVRESDMDIIDALNVARDAGLPWEAILGVTRVLGDSMRRIADTEIRVVHVYIHERLMAAGASEAEVEQLISGIEENLAPLMEPMIQRLHREYLLEAMMEDAFFHLADSHIQARELGSVEATIGFIDIASFTALAEASGDDIAVRVLDRIDAIVRPLLVAHEGKLVKHVGDGFMLAFRDPADAVRFAIATQSELAADLDLPAIRVGINTGPALYRTGDYLGGAVNVASRVVNGAMPGQILLTEPVANAAAKAGIPVEEVGMRMMRGVDEPLALYRVTASR